MAEKGLSLRRVKSGTENLWELTSPYKKEMVDAAHDLGGRWDRTRQRWYFSDNKLVDLQRVIEEIYGRPASVGLTADAVAINTHYEAAMEYVSAISNLAEHLDANQKEAVLIELLESLA